MVENSVNNLNKILFKLFKVLLKYIPYMIAVCYMSYTILSFYFTIDFMGYIAHCSIITWLYLYLSSFVFKYCIYHRVPLYYVICNDIINIIDNFIHMAVSNNTLLITHIIIFLIFCYIYIKLKYLNNGKNRLFKRPRN